MRSPPQDKVSSLGSQQTTGLIGLCCKLGNELRQEVLIAEIVLVISTVHLLKDAPPRGCISELGPPLYIPNSQVKRFRADGSGRNGRKSRYCEEVFIE